jgi:hypothetical protein
MDRQSDGSMCCVFALRTLRASKSLQVHVGVSVSSRTRYWPPPDCDGTDHKPDFFGSVRLEAAMARPS